MAAGTGLRSAGRRRPPRADRFAALVDAATAVFITQGYRRTQMADVADALGVAKGTVYLYVESKEALFDLVIRHAGGQVELDALLPELPLGRPSPTATLELVHRRLTERDLLPALGTALSGPPDPDVARELESILRELFAVLHANRTVIKLVDRCAADHPELAAVWYTEGRVRQVDRLVRYLADPRRRGALRAFPDVHVAARMVIETITTWAVHRHWDPAPQGIDDRVAEETAVAFVLGALVKE